MCFFYLLYIFSTFYSSKMRTFHLKNFNNHFNQYCDEYILLDCRISSSQTTRVMVNSRRCYPSYLRDCCIGYNSSVPWTWRDAILVLSQTQTSRSGWRSYFVCCCCFCIGTYSKRSSHGEEELEWFMSRRRLLQRIYLRPDAYTSYIRLIKLNYHENDEGEKKCALLGTYINGKLLMTVTCDEGNELSNLPMFSVRKINSNWF